MLRTLNKNYGNNSKDSDIIIGYDSVTIVLQGKMFKADIKISKIV